MSKEVFEAYSNPNFKGFNIFKKADEEIEEIEKESKTERIMNTVAWRTGYYRENPHRFCEDYLGIYLKTFQKILIYFMFHFNYFMYLASRGQGKSFLTAIFCCCYAILYPKIQIIVASGKRSQSREVIEKIVGLMVDNPYLTLEIADSSTSTNDPYIKFKNGSLIRTVSANDGARSKRSNILVIDEFVQVPLGIINKVLRKFQTAPRQPKYLQKSEYSHLQERNKELYLSSCWTKYHWSFEKFNAYKTALLEGKQYFVCGLPYQLPIKENLLMREQVIDEMSEDDFDEIGWSMEMDCLWFGENESSYFKLEELNNNRRLYEPIFPKAFYEEYATVIKDNKWKYTSKKQDEIRLISCDISLMATTKSRNNDASVYTIFKLVPTKKGYERQIIYIETYDGGHSTLQAIRIRQLFDDFDCDYIVLDCNGNGMAVYDQLVLDIYDTDRHKEYTAFTCINDEDMADRCMVNDAPAKIYSIKADAKLNTACAVEFKDNLKKGKIKLLVNDMEAKEMLKGIKGSEKLTIEDKVKFLLPNTQTTLLINEMINLEADYKERDIKLTEPRSGRKDRYSSATYGNYVAKLLERDLNNNNDSTGWDNAPRFVSSIEFRL